MRGTPRRRGPPRSVGGSRRRSRGSGTGSPSTPRRSSDHLQLAVADLAAQRGVVGPGHPLGEGLLVAALVEERADHVADVVVEPRAGDLVGTELLAELRVQAEAAAEVDLEALH